ncbi:MAG: hypothetical protein RL538_304 [Candidatus Parcubacteria bacterium]
MFAVFSFFMQRSEEKTMSVVEEKIELSATSTAAASTEELREGVEDGVGLLSDVIPKEEKSLSLTESCDFQSMKMYLESLLAQSSWKDILLEYPLQQYREVEDAELDMWVNSSRPQACVLEVTLRSKELTFAEFEKAKYPYFSAVSHVLTLLNPSEDYSSGSVVFSPNQHTDFTFGLADGPNGSSFGTYQLDEKGSAVRIFTVHGGTKREKSPYEVERDEETCPCEQGLTIRMTEDILLSEFD